MFLDFFETADLMTSLDKLAEWLNTDTQKQIFKHCANIKNSLSIYQESNC